MSTAWLSTLPTRRLRRPLTRWGLVLILAAAAILRVSHLTDRSLWFDEAFSWRLIQFPVAEFFKRAAADVHPVLYYVALWLWSAPLTLGHIDLSLFWLRALSVVFAVGTAGTVFFAGKVLFRSRWIGTVAALLTTVNAFQIQYAWEARMYTLGTLLLPLSLALLVLITRATSHTWRWWYAALFGLATGAFLHVHYYALFSVAALVVFVGVFLVQQAVRHGTVRRWHPSGVPLLGGLLLTGALFAPWVPIFLAQRAQVQAAYWIPPMDAWSIPNTMARLMLGGAEAPSDTTAVLSSIVIAGAVLAALVRGRTRSDALLALSFAVPFLGSWWLSQTTSIYQDRYFVFASLPLLLLGARVVSFLPRSWRALLVLVLAIGGLATTVRFWHQLQFGERPGAAGAATVLSERAQHGEPIIVSSSFVYFPIAFHLGCKLPEAGGQDEDRRCASGLLVRLFSGSEELAHFSGGPILVPEDLIGPEVFAVGHPRLWVVDTTGFGGSRLAVPAPYALAREESFRELYAYQGDIIVREYIQR